MRLSQCMIVKNEEDNIKRALSWGKAIAREQIVVDTGSTDKTVEIAEHLGAKVYHFPWTDDFSAAKNFAIEKASGDYIAFLDADEYMMPESAKELEIFLNKIDKLKEEDKPLIIRSILVSLDDNGMPLQSTKQDRIFRNTKELRYKNRIHEVLALTEGSKKSLTFFDMDDKVRVLHTGYSESAVECKGKTLRNITLLKKESAEQPDNLELQVYFGEALISGDRKKEADQVFLKLYKEKMDKIPKIFGNMTFYHLLRYRVFNVESNEGELEDLYKKAIRFDPEYPDSDYLLGIWYARQENWEKTFHYLEMGIKKMEHYTGQTPTHMDAEIKAVYQALAVSAFELGRPADTVRYGILCLRTDKYTLDVLQILLFLLKGEPGEAETAAGTMGILKGIYDFSHGKDKLVVVECALRVEFACLANCVKALMTKEERSMLISDRL